MDVYIHMHIFTDYLVVNTNQTKFLGVVLPYLFCLAFLFFSYKKESSSARSSRIMCDSSFSAVIGTVACYRTFIGTN